MRAVVLVGGFGTRLRPLTDTMPKSMLPIAHVPLIVRLIGQLERGGVDAVTLALGFLPEPFVDAFPDGRCGGVALDYAVEPEPLDTAGAIRFAADHAGIDDTFVVANGDVLTDLDDRRPRRRPPGGRGAEATIHLIPVDDPSAFGVVELDDDGRILRFVEKPPAGTEPSNLINAGTYVFEPSVLDRIPPGRPVSIERETFPLLVAGGRFHAMATDGLLDRRRPPGAVPAGQPRPGQRDGGAEIVQGRRDGRRRRIPTPSSTTASSGPAPRSVPGRRSPVRCCCPAPSSAPAPWWTDSVVAGAVGDGARIVRCRGRRRRHDSRR